MRMVTVMIMKGIAAIVAMHSVVVMIMCVRNEAHKLSIGEALRCIMRELIQQAPGFISS
jgi:hypothetical protein